MNLVNLRAIKIILSFIELSAQIVEIVFRRRLLWVLFMAIAFMFIYQSPIKCTEIEAIPVNVIEANSGQMNRWRNMFVK